MLVPERLAVGVDELDLEAVCGDMLEEAAGGPGGCDREQDRDGLDGGPVVDVEARTEQAMRAQ